MTTAEFIPAYYCTPGRQGKAVELIALHWMAGTLAATDRTFTDGVRQASAHYGHEDGVVHQYVSEADTAWALGNWDANLRSISIEISSEPGRAPSEATYASVIAQVTELCKQRGLGADAITQHNHFYNTQCPGLVDVERIRGAVAANLAAQYAPNVGTAPAEALPAPQAAAPYAWGGCVWNVEPGDTLGEIAAYYGITVDAIAGANGIQDPNAIQAGQSLVIPGRLIWTVEPGDTLGAIANYYGLDVETVAANNGIQDPNVIQPGQVIVIQ